MLTFKSSKLTETVFQQMHSHMTLNSLYPELQSLYHQHHSTEIALLKVMNDILLNMNFQQVTLMVLLDLSVAFDTLLLIFCWMSRQICREVVNNNEIVSHFPS